MLKDILDVRPFWRSFVGKNFPVVFDNGHFDAVSKKNLGPKSSFYVQLSYMRNLTVIRGNSLENSSQSTVQC